MTPSDSSKPAATSGTPESANPTPGREATYPVQSVMPGAQALMDVRAGWVMPGYGPGYPPMGNTVGTEGAKPMDPLSLFMALKRRWFLALLLGVLSAGVASSTVWYMWPPNSGGVQASLFVNSVPPYVIDPGPASDFNIYRKTQLALIRSRKVLAAAVARPEVAELAMVQRMGDGAVSYLEGNLGADYITAPEVMTVTLAGAPEDEAELPTLLNGVIEAYLHDIVHLEQNGRYKRLEKLKEIYDELDQSLQGKLAALDALSKAVHTRDLHQMQVQHNFAVRQLNRSQDELLNYGERLRKSEFDLKVKRLKLQALEQVPLPKEAVDAIIAKDSEVHHLSQKVDETTTFMNDTAQVLQGGKDHPEVKRIKEQLDDLRKELERRREEVRPEAEAEVRQSIEGEMAAEVGNLEEEIQNLKEAEKMMSSMVDKLIQATQEASDTNVEMEDLKADIAAIQAKAGEFGAQMDNIKIELHAADRVSKVDDPVYFGPSIGKKQLLATWGAGAGALALVLFGVSYWEFRARRINTLDEIVHGLGLKVVGALPALPDRRTRALPSRDPFYPNYLIESVDTTRTMLLHAARKDQLQSVVVTSARPGEGKTSLSIQLAASLSRAGRKTLFIDGDMRNPAANRLFNLPLGPGLSELLRGEIDVAAAIQPTSVRNLWMIPAGRWNAQATEALAQESFRPLLAQLKAEFDFIVVDSSPVLAVVDGLLLAQQVDAAVFSILNDVSHAPSVYAAYQRLENLGVRILGAVVNGMTANQFGYKADYGYGAPAEGSDFAVTTTETH